MRSFPPYKWQTLLDSSSRQELPSLNHYQYLRHGQICGGTITILTPINNNGKTVSENLVWQDFYKLTFRDDNKPAIKDSRQEFGYYFTNWGIVPLFDNSLYTLNWLNQYSNTNKNNWDALNFKFFHLSATYIFEIFHKPVET